MISSVILILIVACAMLLAALFAGSETGTYQLSRLRLRIGVEDKRLPFIILAKIIGDGPGLLVSILIGTNLAFYIITSIVTYMKIIGWLMSITNLIEKGVESTILWYQAPIDRQIMEWAL